MSTADLATLLRSLSTSRIVTCFARDAELAKLAIAAGIVPAQFERADMMKHTESMARLLDALRTEIDARIPARGGAA